MGIEHALLPEQGLVAPGEAVIGADSHTCTYGALGAFSTGVGSTDMAAGMASGENWFRVPSAIKVVLTGKMRPYVSGKDVILKIEVEGAMNIKRLFPECCLVFILPPSMQELERRLRKRGTETEEKIIERTAQAREELKFAENYDYLIVNGALEKAVDDLRAVISAEKLRKVRQMPLLNQLRAE